MPMGSFKNNFTAVVAGTFIIISLLSTFLGQVAWNTRNIKANLEQQAAIIKNQEELIVEHREMLVILRSLERRYLADQDK